MKIQVFQEKIMFNFGTCCVEKIMFNFGTFCVELLC